MSGFKERQSRERSRHYPTRGCHTNRDHESYKAATPDQITHRVFIDFISRQVPGSEESLIIRERGRSDKFWV